MPIKHTLNNKQNKIIEPVYCEDCKYGYMIDSEDVCTCPELLTIKRHALYKCLNEVKYANPRQVNMHNNCMHYKKDYIRIYVLKIIMIVIPIAIMFLVAYLAKK